MIVLVATGVAGGRSDKSLMSRRGTSTADHRVGRHGGGEFFARLSEARTGRTIRPMDLTRQQIKRELENNKMSQRTSSKTDTDPHGRWTNESTQSYQKLQSSKERSAVHSVI